MSAISKVLRQAEGGRLSFWCPGCNCVHQIAVGEGQGPRWGYNGNPEKPTFAPSVLVRSGHYAGHHKPGDCCWCTYNAEHPEEDDPAFKCGICHTFVTDGRIQFLSDCTHHLAGQTVDMVEKWEPGQ